MATGEEPSHDQQSPRTFLEADIIVLGAGIIGLSVARALLIKGFRVIIVAKHLPGDQDIFYTSNWAGASWSGKGETDEQRYILATGYRHLTRLAKTEPDSGVCIVRAKVLYDKSPELDGDTRLWYKSVTANWRRLEPGSYDARFEYGCEYDSPVVDPPLHLPFLHRQIEALGGQVVRREVASIHELFTSYPDSKVFINASGLGARDLGGVNDRKVYPDRGQNVLVSSDKTASMTSLSGDEYTYIIPRPNSKILVCGGVHQPHNLNPKVEWDVVEDTIRRANRAVPHLISLTPKVSSHVIGIRSTRDGGYRLQPEQVMNTGRQRRHMLHAYGFGSSGYAHAYGVADALLRMVENIEFSQTAAKSDLAKL